MILFLATLTLVLLPAVAVVAIGYRCLLIPERTRRVAAEAEVSRQRAVIAGLVAPRRRRPWVEGRPSQIEALRPTGES